MDINLAQCCIDYRTKKVIYFNNSFGILVGHNLDSKLPFDGTFYQLLPHEEILNFNNCIAEIQHNCSSILELKLLHKDGSINYFKGIAIYDGISDKTLEKLLIIGTSSKPNIKSLILDNNKLQAQFSILQNISDSFFYLDKGGKFLFANNAFLSFFSIPFYDSINGKKVWDILQAEDNILFREKYEYCIKNNVVVEFEMFFSFNKWLKITLTPIEVGLCVFLQDITVIKKNKQIQAESGDRLHLIYDNLHMYIWAIDENLNSVFFNKAFINYSGHTFNDLIEYDWIKLVHTDDLEKISIALHRGFTYKTEINCECRILRHDGEYKWIKINASVQNNDEDKFKGFLFTGIDISEAKYYSEKIEEKNIEFADALNESRRLSGILDKTSNSIFLTDNNGNITWANEAFTKLSEYKLLELIGKKPEQLVYGPETNPETIDLLREGIRKGEVTRVEIINYSKNGRKFWVDLRIEPIYKNGLPDGYIAIQLDITKRKKDEIIIKERNDKLKEFSYITSHELRQEFSKILMELNFTNALPNTVSDFKNLLQELDTPVSKVNFILSKINESLNSEANHKSAIERLHELEEIKEICLVDDDQLTNMVHKQLIKIIIPGTPIRVFEDVDSVLNYLRIQPFNNRIIFLDLNFPSAKSGWDFLEEYQHIDLSAPIIILSSSIDNEDLNKSKKYKNVLEYLIKPLTVDVINKYVKK